MAFGAVLFNGTVLATFKACSKFAALLTAYPIFSALFQLDKIIYI